MMSSSTTPLIDGARLVAELVVSEEGHLALLLEDDENVRFLHWEGPTSWLRDIELLYGCGELEAMPIPHRRLHTEEGQEQLLLRCPSPRLEPFDVWKWRNMPPRRAVAALRELALTLRTIHDGGYALHGIRRADLLLDAPSGRLLLAALPRLRALDDDSETVWRDIRIFAELAYENFLDHEYPGGHQLVTLLQDREAMADMGIIAPGLSQLMAGCVTPYGDLAYHSIDELLEGLDHLWVELQEPLDYRVGSRSTQGNHIFRQNNQDSCGHVVVHTICGSRKIRQGFFCVADGIGGIQDGERASALAVRTACSAFLRAWNHDDGDKIHRAPVLFARAIAQVTSQRLALEGDFSPRRNRGGTTFTGLLLSGDRAGLCHVGDSRAVLIREGRIIALSRDHTLATILERLGEVPGEGEAAASHRTISRFFSTGAELEWDRIDGFCDAATDEITSRGGYLNETGLKVEKGDIFVLTSDGAHGEVNDEEIKRLVTITRGNPQRLCDAIVERVLLQIGRDNATVLAVLIE